MDTRTGWIACDYTQGDRLCDVENCGTFFATSTEAREMNDMLLSVDPWVAYDGVRFVGKDGYLYVDKPYDEEEEL